MASLTTPLPAGVIVIPAGEGRHYPCGPMQSVFLADGGWKISAIHWSSRDRS